MKSKERLALEHIAELVNAQSAPALPEALAGDELAVCLHNQLIQLRSALGAFSTGDMSQSIKMRGFMAGNLKDLQAHLRHLIWQVQQVEQGDYSQRVAFLGDFSVAFNNMVIKLEQTVGVLRDNAIALREQNNRLRTEVDSRMMALAALQEDAERLSYLAGHDSLTGVMNRRYFMEKAQDLLKVSATHSMPCSFIMMDIDFFKRFNDSAGHLAGDAALQHIAKISSTTLRATDIMGRYGGEEFVFCLPYVSSAQAFEAAERIRNAIETIPLNFDKAQHSFTASLGVASARPEVGDALADVLSAVIGQADKALYAAKGHGRNRVTQFEEGQPD